jgi:hypothetical protein
MAVQIKPSQPKEQHNGLPALEADIIQAPKGEEITAIVTYVREKRVEDEKTDDYYPVLGIRHIEPVTGDLAAKAKELQLLAYQSRTGENELDFSGVGEDSDESDEGATVTPFKGKSK